MKNSTILLTFLVLNAALSPVHAFKKTISFYQPSQSPSPSCTTGFHINDNGKENEKTDEHTAFNEETSNPSPSPGNEGSSNPSPSSGGRPATQNGFPTLGNILGGFSTSNTLISDLGINNNSPSDQNSPQERNAFRSLQGVIDCSTLNGGFRSNTWCVTSTPSWTSTPTPSRSKSPIPSKTSSASLTPVSSVSPTPSATLGPISSASPTASASSRPSRAQTKTPAPSVSLTATPTITTTPTVTSSPSVTPSITPTVSYSSSPSITPTPSASSSTTPTPSSSSSVTPTPSSSSSLTPTPSVTQTVSPTPSGTRSVSPTPSTTPDPCLASFNPADFFYSIPHTFDGYVTNDSGPDPFPIGTYSLTPDKVNCNVDMVLTGAASTREVAARLVEVKAINDIPDLSVYGLAKARYSVPDSGIPTSPTYTFSGSLNAGEFLYITNNQDNFEAFFGFTADIVNSVGAVSGSDVVILFKDGVAVDQIGSFHIPLFDWDYYHSWAIRNV